MPFLLALFLFLQVIPHTAKTSSITLVVGRGELMQFPDIVERVSISEPNIADIVAVGPQEVTINAKAPGLAHGRSSGTRRDCRATK